LLAGGALWVAGAVLGGADFGVAGVFDGVGVLGAAPAGVVADESGDDGP
jgi:hypothetical protein